MSRTMTDDDVLADAWLAEPRRRSRWRRVLLVSLASSLVFLGGVEVQKQFGTAPASAAPAGGFGSGRPEGFPAGGLGGFGGGAGSSPGAATGGTTGSPDAASAVIGTVVAIDGDVWTVEDLGGTRHQITVTSARVNREERIDAAAVEVGATVDITGAEKKNGSLTASVVTVR